MSSIRLEARKYRDWRELAEADVIDEAIVAEVCRRNAMTSIAAREGGHIETVVDETLGDYLDAMHPDTEFLELPRDKVQRREMLERAAINEDPEVAASVEKLWRTMRHYRGALIEEETTRLIHEWLAADS